MSEHTINLDLSIVAEIGQDCDGGHELRAVKFADINDSIGIDIGDYVYAGSDAYYSGWTVKDMIADKLQSYILAQVEKEES